MSFDPCDNSTVAVDRAAASTANPTSGRGLRRATSWRLAARTASLLLAAPLLLASATADASPIDIYGTGARSGAMGRAVVADPSGPDAVHYNVAGLARAPQSLSLTYLFTLQDARIRLMPRPDGFDIPDLGPDTPTIPSSRTLRARSGQTGPAPANAFSLGGSFPIGFQNLRGGFLFHLPVEGTPWTSRFPDERERLFSNALQFDVLNQVTNRLDIQAGIAWPAFDWLSLGIGATFLPALTTTTNVYVPDPTALGDVSLNLRADQDAALAASAGILAEPLPWLRVGLSFRDAVAFRIRGANRLQLRGIEIGEDEEYPVVQRYVFTPAYSPATFALGSAFVLRRVTLTADLVYHHWQDFRDTHDRKAGFENTLAPRIGVEYDVSRFLTVRGGLGFDPSPVPPQTGRTNFVDNDRVIASLGASRVLSFGLQRMEVGLFAQIHTLLPERTIKAQRTTSENCDDPGVRTLCDEVRDDLVDPQTGLLVPGTAGLQTGNPGFPGWTSGGWFGAFGLELKWILP